MKLKSKEILDNPVFRDPYYPRNDLRRKVTTYEAGHIAFEAKETPVDADALMPRSTGEKVRRGVLIFLGICIIVAVIVIGIYMIRNFGELQTNRASRFF